MSMHTLTYTRTRTHIHTRTHIYAHKHTHTHMYLHIGRDTCLRIQKKEQHARTYTHARTHIHTLQVAPKVLKAVQTACKLYGVRNVDLWSKLLVSVSMCV